ncbi:MULTISPECIES: TolC family protein [Methylococcus]|uniref:Outer membrane protein, heavy metal efflux system n=1 Tax=Methylococcus capsulatus TaxID=414 RepID=A0AA35V1X7_METCP|nr:MULTISPECIES: TolC family protein [Methylococcus]UQN12436.1 TolC family protein [Methylococcus capsulatus]CAI8860624.1 outer membrane protein, heavy metal efflux system [Methylococcus capsulatus]
MKSALLWLGLMWPVFAATQVNLPQVSLEQLIQEARDHNPEIHAMRQRWESARAVVPQVQTLPDPKIAVGYTDIAPMKGPMYGISQEIPFPGKLALKGEIASREAERTEQDYLATQLTVIARLKELFYELCFIHKSNQVITKNKSLLEGFAKTAEGRYSVGQAAQQDILRAQTEISRLLARLAILEQRRQSLHAEINRILNRLPSDPLGAPQEIRITPMRHALTELNTLLEQGSPLLRGQQKGLERGNQAVALANRQYYPDFELDARGQHDTAMHAEGYQVMLRVQVPLYFATKQRQGVREAVASREAVFQDLQALRQDLLARIKDNVAQAERAEQLVRLLRDGIIPQSRLTLASAQASYAVGKVDFLTLLNSLLTLQENELEFHGEITEHEKALARLEAIIGETP